LTAIIQCLSMRSIKKSSWAWACFFLLGGIGCGSDEPEKKVSNLVVTLVVDQNGSGQVAINAGADNVKFFKYFFGESNDEELIKTEDRHASHTYENSGTYTIRVQAHSSESDFIFHEEDIDVDVFIDMPTTGNTSPETRSSMTLIWQEEFNGTSIDATKWTFETGNGTNGWGNNELEYYRKENASIVEGNLMIEARAEAFGGKNYTSTRMITKGKFDFKYGRVDVRAALPEGKGVWPAIWMLGANFSEPGVGWPKCGEIDIMEKIGGGIEEKKIYGTPHWFAENNAPGQQNVNFGGSFTASTEGIFNDKFHVFSIVWNETYIIWYVDDVEFHRIDITPSGLSEFHEDFFLLLNVAVGGNWPGSPDSSTKFPQRMFVDYIRVFQPQ
jgi:beta-glucanase (GH16 family)